MLINEKTKASITIMEASAVALTYFYKLDGKVYLKNEAPAWVKEILYVCHMDTEYFDCHTLTDDYIYRMVYEALTLVKLSPTYEDADRMCDYMYLSHSDSKWLDLQSWLQSNGHRRYYLEYVMTNEYARVHGVNVLKTAQQIELKYLSHRVKVNLLDYVEEINKEKRT